MDQFVRGHGRSGMRWNYKRHNVRGKYLLYGKLVLYGIDNLYKSRQSQSNKLHGDFWLQLGLDVQS